MSTLYKIRNRAAAQGGFSLIELLVVVLIIGILATIMIPRFIGQRDTANNSSAKSNLRNAASAAESAYQINGESFVDALTVAQAIATSEPGLSPQGTCGSGTLAAGTCATFTATGLSDLSPQTDGSAAVPANIYIGTVSAGKTGSAILCNSSKGSQSYCIKLRGDNTAQYGASPTGISTASGLLGAASNWNN